MFERAKEVLSRWIGRDTLRRRAHEIYVTTAQAARRPEFFTDLGVPDTVEGRYDLVSLHVILVLRTLKTKKDETARLAQLVFDVMFRDVDDTLREMGVGDLRVGKKVREYAEAFFGRALAYEQGLDGEISLEDALARNVYGSDDARVGDRLAGYVRRANAQLEEAGPGAIEAGKIVFPPVTEEREAA